ERRRGPAAAASTRALPGGGPRRRRGRRHRWMELLDGGVGSPPVSPKLGDAGAVLPAYGSRSLSRSSGVHY
uniref:Uncharacterized protein n=1 Tax=Aegilops tauschii subsp. strangulata TaxID=200361 RepID=A0A453IUK5_AEGTS